MPPFLEPLTPAAVPASRRTTPSADAPGASVVSAPAAPAARRVGWADVAKGLCILLVVLHHVVGKHLPDAVALLGAPQLVLTAWDAVDVVFKPMRMPLFFMISGMFCASALRRPWGQVLVRKVVTPYWVYAVWLGLHAVVFTHLATSIGTHRAPLGPELLGYLLYAATGLWYLYALAAYFVLARLLGWLPAWLVVGAAAALSAATTWLPLEGVNRESVAECFVYFLAGARLPDLLRRMPLLPAGGLLPLLVGYGALAATCAALGVPHGLKYLLLAAPAVVLGAQLAMHLERRPRVGPGLAALGRRTLPVYVLHMVLLGLLHEVVLRLPAADVAPGGHPAALVLATVVALAWPAVLTAALVAACLGLQRGLVAAGAGVLFAPPGRLVGAGRPTSARKPDTAPERALPNIG